MSIYPRSCGQFRRGVKGNFPKTRELDPAILKAFSPRFVAFFWEESNRSCAFMESAWGKTNQPCLVWQNSDASILASLYGCLFKKKKKKKPPSTMH